ncbi:acyltransferase [Bacteroides finegoldii]|uniref:acyltransferase n=1 Tax=Bacteroides finegoldii TaxID=338188 RepID=UPI00189E73E0|nr:acyltransferase family protein [Bacteroides finegoldii]
MKRLLYLDIIRLIACLMVIVMHAPMPGVAAETHGAFLVQSSYFTAPCVPLFFMVSGALLLPCKEGVSAGKYLKNRMGKIICPAVIFSLFYIALSGNWQSVWSIPFSAQGHGVLWFVYTLAGLYLLIPIISPWLRNASKGEVELYLGVWFVTLLYPYLCKVFFVNTDVTGILYYFTGYSGYFLFGYYLKNYSISLKWLVPLAFAMLPLPVFNKVLGWNLDFYSAFWYLSAPVAVMTAAWFCVMKYLFDRVSVYNFLTQISNLSFGIYLLHIFVMRQLLWNWWIIQEVDNYYLQTLIIVLLVFMISFIVCLLISKLPLSQYIIGYTTRNKK